MWLPPSSAYTADDLLRAAKARAFPATKRLITDWVTIGLLDQPNRRGRGRAKGVERTWPASQFQLWLVLLDKRRDITHVASLCNIPVFLWLNFGTEYAPVRQVRRALGFFNRLVPGMSVTAARKAARSIVAQLSAPTATRADQNALVEAIVSATGGGEFNRDLLLDPVRRIFDPEQTGRRIGPAGAPMTAESWVDYTEALIVGAQTIPDLRDEEFETARLAHHDTLAMYVVQQPAFAQDPEIGSIFDAPTISWLANNACSNITTEIGFRELARRRGASEGAAPPQT